MKTNEAGLALIKKWEGFRSKPYLCSAGVATIGYGSTMYENGTKVNLSDKPIDEERASELFRNTLTHYEKGVRDCVHSAITDNQFAALVSFAYNLGTGSLRKSTLLKLVNINPNDGQIAKEFLKWNKAGGKELKGLTNRRVEESALYFRR